MSLYDMMFSQSTMMPYFLAPIWYRACFPAATSSSVGASDFLISDTLPSAAVASSRRSMTRFFGYWS